MCVIHLPFYDFRTGWNQYGKPFKGLLFLFAGIMLSILFLLILPDIMFEYDHYSAPAAWLFSWGPVMYDSHLDNNDII